MYVYIYFSNLFFYFFLVLHEAVSTGDPELVQIVLKHRDYQRYSKRTVGVPELLQKLKEVCIERQRRELN